MILLVGQNYGDNILSVRNLYFFFRLKKHEDLQKCSYNISEHALVTYSQALCVIQTLYFISFLRCHCL